jgi:hypothetical protein
MLMEALKDAIAMYVTPDGEPEWLDIRLIGLDQRVGSQRELRLAREGSAGGLLAARFARVTRTAAARQPAEPALGQDCATRPSRDGRCGVAG